MKVITAHLNIKIIVISAVLLIVFAACIPTLVNYKLKQKTDVSETPANIKTETTFEETTEKTMKDKNGNEYIPSSNITVYLTFDDGPSKNTNEILNILDTYGIGATFFVINGKYNSYMKDIVNRGSAIALHSYSHKYPEIYSSPQAFIDDICKIHDLVLEETGVDTKIIRFPGGSSNTISSKYCKNIMKDLEEETEKMGYIYFDWNCENGDADGKETSVEYQVKRATKYNKNDENIVILMHDIDICGVNTTALKEIIEFYQGEGANFSVITENSPQIHHKVNN